MHNGYNLISLPFHLELFLAIPYSQLFFYLFTYSFRTLPGYSFLPTIPLSLHLFIPYSSRILFLSPNNSIISLPIHAVLILPYSFSQPFHYGISLSLSTFFTSFFLLPSSFQLISSSFCPFLPPSYTPLLTLLCTDCIWSLVSKPLYPGAKHTDLVYFYLLQYPWPLLHLFSFYPDPKLFLVFQPICGN